MKRRALPVAALALCAMLVLTAASSPESQVPSLAEIRARDFKVTLLDGTTVPLGTLIGNGEPLVIEFWATWCAPCRKTLPHLVALKRAHGDSLVVLGLTVEDPKTAMEKVRDYARSEGVNFSVAFAPRELFQFMNSRPDIAVPKLFVFDRAGTTVAYIPRYSPFTGRKLDSAVKKALSHRARPDA
jgi:thiol-disulfide isomerase/thioredoxin